MTCIAGTLAQPRVWWRLTEDDAQRIDGRWCTHRADRTTPRSCGACPAYRGLDRFGVRQTGIGPDGGPYGLTDAEYDAFNEAMIEGELPDFIARMEAGGRWALQGSGTLEWDEQWAAYMREYRARPGYVDRTAAARMRRYRARKRYVKPPQENNSCARPETPHGRARAREGGALYVTQEDADGHSA